MFKSIQKKIKEKMTVQAAYLGLDNTDKGYLTLRNFHANFGRMFGFYLKGDEIIALFKEIDTDEDSIVYFKDFEDFYHRNFVQKIAKT